jgi:4-hydroxybenzoate polyprenyltransferase
MEDFKGDAEDGCITMPIKIGLQKTTQFAQLLLAITTILLAVIAVLLIQKGWWAPSIYMIVTLAVPLTLIFMKIGKKTTSVHYAFYSKMLKIVMVLGIATLVFFYLYQY